MHPVAGVVLAVASAIAFAISTVGQQRTAARTSDEDARAGRLAGQLLRDPRWLGATLGNAVGYVLQAAALGMASVFLVQPILVTSLLFALPLSARLARVRLPPSAVTAGVLLTASLAVFETVGHTSGGASTGSGPGWIAISAAGVPMLGACLALARTRSARLRAAVLAVAVGLLGGVLAVLTKTVVDVGADNLTRLLGTGETYALIVVGIGGIYLQQLSFQAGALRTSLPIMIVLEPVVAALLGLTLLHEHVPPGKLRMVCLVAAAAIAAFATVALARTGAGGPAGAPQAHDESGRRRLENCSPADLKSG